MISIVIPVYNNGLTLDALTQQLHSVTAPLGSYEIIFIDDGSIDNSLEKLRSLAQSNTTVKVLSLSRNFGQHAAISAGFENASGDIIILMDADLQDNPSYIPSMISQLTPDIDIVYTIKTSSRSSDNRITSRFFYYLFSKIIKSKTPRNIGTYRAFTRKFLKAILQYQERNIVYGPLMHYMGFRSTFMDVVHQKRLAGNSSYTFTKRLKLSIDALVSYTNVPYKIFIWMGVCLFAISFIYGICVILAYLFYGRILLSGLTLILLFLLITLASVMVSLGIIGNYIFRIFQEVLDRPRYLISESINIK